MRMDREIEISDLKYFLKQDSKISFLLFVNSIHSTNPIFLF